MDWKIEFLQFADKLINLDKVKNTVYRIYQNMIQFMF